MESTYVGLHSHSFFSLGDALSSPEDMILKAKSLGSNSLALTDHGTLAGWYQFYQAAKRYSIKPLFGLEAYFVENVTDIYINNEKLASLKKVADSLKKIKALNEEQKDILYKAQEGVQELQEIRNKLKKYSHLILIARTSNGYKNLVKIHNDSVIDGIYYKPRIDFAVLEKYAVRGNLDLIGTSSCLGSMINKLLANDEFSNAVNTVLRFKKIFGPGNFYLELQLHEIDLQTTINHALIKLAQETDTPLTLSADSHYLEEGQGKTRSLIRNLDKEPDEVNNDDILQTLYMLNDTFALKLWRKYMPGTDTNILAEAICNTRKIAESVQHFEIDTSLKFPVFDAGTLCQEDFLIKNAWEGLRKKGLAQNPEYIKRLQFELDTVNPLGFASYFNVVSDIVREAKKYQPVGPARGSAGGSLLAFVTGITNIDPLQFSLYFERFIDSKKGVIAPTFGLGDVVTNIQLDYNELINQGNHKHDIECACTQKH